MILSLAVHMLIASKYNNDIDAFVCHTIFLWVEVVNDFQKFFKGYSIKFLMSLRCFYNALLFLWCESLGYFKTIFYCDSSN